MLLGLSMPQTSTKSTMTSPYCPSDALPNANNNRIVFRSRSTSLAQFCIRANCIQLSAPTNFASLYLSHSYLHICALVVIDCPTFSKFDHSSQLHHNSVTTIDKHCSHSLGLCPKSFASNIFYLQSFFNLSHPLQTLHSQFTPPLQPPLNPNQNVRTKWQHPTT
jgi:hypothetical protein